MSEINNKKNISNIKSHSSQGLKKSKFVAVKMKPPATTETASAEGAAGRARGRRAGSDGASAGRSLLAAVSSHDTAALSADLSRCELLRNLSALNCRSRGSLSAGARDVACSSSAALYKRELLDKYLRSVDKWHKEYKMFDANRATYY